MLLESKVEKLKISTSERAVIKYISQIKTQAVKMSEDELASGSYTSKATVSRAIKHAGYRSLSEFRREFEVESQYMMQSYYNMNPNMPFEREESLLSMINKIFDLMHEALWDTKMLLEQNQEELDQAITLLNEAKFIHVCGSPYGRELAHIFVNDISKIGRLVNVIANGQYLSSVVTKKDVVICICYEDDRHEQKEQLKTLRDLNVPVILISALGKNPLKELATVFLPVTSRENVYFKVKGFATQISALMIFNALYSGYFLNKYDEHVETIRLNQNI